MRWLKPNLRSSIYALLGQSSASAAVNVQQRTDEIRRAMLDLLGERGDAEHPHLVRRVRFAIDLQTLWYARSELMGALAGLHGEAKARDLVAGITDMFRGLLPESLTPRAPPSASR